MFTRMFGLAIVLAATTWGPADATDPIAVDSPLVVYARQSIPLALSDTSKSMPFFGAIGVVPPEILGASVVADNDIRNPADDMAREVAREFAAAHGYRFQDGGVSIDDEKIERIKSGQLAEVFPGATYVVSVSTGGTDLMEASTMGSPDPDGSFKGRFDLLFGAVVHIEELPHATVAGRSGCFLMPEKRPGLLTHNELLADHAAGLKALLKMKTDQCMSIIKAELKI